jgi:hypothetical protein
MKLITLLVPLSVAVASTVHAAPLLKDGIYRSTISNMHLGDMEIMGNSYRGPAYDQQWGDTFSFEETSGGTLNWGGPLGGITAAGKAVSTVLKDAGGGTIGYDIMIQNDRGNFQTISCSPE